jgi:hypothetical protein
VKTRKRRVRLGREHWSGIVEEYEESGLTQREFCERRGIRFTTFRNWLYRLRDQRDRRRAAAKSMAGQFVRLVPTAPKPGVLCKVHYGRAEVLFSDLPPTEYLSGLLRLMDR